jgi:hypothetical protein
MRDFLDKTPPIQDFYCTFAPVLGKATNRLSNLSTKLAEN